MQYTTKAANCLFANVSIKASPYSNAPVAIRITAHNFEGCPANKALYYSELPLYYTSLAKIQQKIEDFRVQNNSKTSVVKMQPKVLQFVQAQNVA